MPKHILDQVLASSLERQTAKSEAVLAVRSHGDAAIDFLREKLNDPNRRTRGKRVIRLAIRWIEKGRVSRRGSTPVS